MFEIIVAYIDGTADMGVVVTMMIMFTKHSLSISEDKQKQIEHSFLLVFSKLDEIGEINEERIRQYYEQVEKDKEDKKYRIYRQMADD